MSLKDTVVWLFDEPELKDFIKHPFARSNWRIGVLFCWIVAMIATPTTDPGSMIMVAFLLCFVYFVGFGLWRGKS